MLKKVFVLLLTAITVGTMASNVTIYAEDNYTYGDGETFHSDVPVVYSILYPDSEKYPYQDDWQIWKEIEKLTNVTLDPVVVSKADYGSSVNAALQSDNIPYIIPDISNTAEYEDSQELIELSEYIQYMPNFSRLLNEWGTEEDLKQIYDKDGKFYRIPVMYEEMNGGNTLIIRKDIFEAAGIGFDNENQWTWDDFHNALSMVQKYTKKDYIWSDQYQLGSAMNLAASTWGVTAGYSAEGDWGLKDGTVYDPETKVFNFMETTAEYKDFLTYFNTLYKEKILDPYTFIQDSLSAQEKFFTGESYVLSGNYRLYAEILAEGKMQDPEAELYLMTTPSGPMGNLKISSKDSRIGSGMMITRQILKDCDEEELIKMLRFVDWLWYSEEGQMLSQWGIEDETYHKDEEGIVVLNEEIEYNGLNPDAKMHLTEEYGYGLDLFSVGGSLNMQYSRMTPAEREWNQRINYSKQKMKIAPPILADEDTLAELEQIRMPLMAYVQENTIAFICGEKDLESAEWEKYVEECVNEYRAAEYVARINELAAR